MYQMIGQGVGQAIAGWGRYMGDRKREKEFKKMQSFIMDAYNTYLNDPGRKEAQSFVSQIIKSGDYGNIFEGAYQQALARNRINNLLEQQRIQQSAARGGMLRSGQTENLLNRTSNQMLGADREAAFGKAQQQFGAKQWATPMADNLAQGPFGAAMTVAPSIPNPYVGKIWNEVSNAGNVVSSMFGGQQLQNPSTAQSNNLMTQNIGPYRPSYAAQSPYNYAQQPYSQGNYGSLMSSQPNNYVMMSSQNPYSNQAPMLTGWGSFS